MSDAVELGMFFSLSKTKDVRFPFHHDLPNGLIVNSDDGWKSYTNDTCNILAKGYTNQSDLSDIIKNLATTHDTPKLKGNFCAFVSDGDYVRLLHDRNRSFPLWMSDNSLTNLYAGSEQIWADCLVTCDGNLTITKKWFQTYNDYHNSLSDDEVIDNIHNTLCETFEQFLTHNRLPIKIFLSGGIDTLTLWTYLDHFTKNYEILDYEYLKYTKFYKSNYERLREFWGYNQIHLWKDDTILLTGACGDEYLFRGPYMVALFLQQKGLTFEDILKKNDYHYDYFLKKSSITTADAQQTYKESWSRNDLVNHICNIATNDHQHWHIDRTITFTPFKNIDLLTTILSGSDDLILSQARDATINKLLISRLDPDKLRFLSTYKNKNRFENM